MPTQKPKPWLQLATELKQHGVVSEYLARVEGRVDREERFDQLQREIAHEMAGALGRAGDKVDLAFAELQLRRARYDRAQRAGAAAHEQRALADDFNTQRALAERRLRELLIHREAMGFRRNQILNELYPLPPKLHV